MRASARELLVPFFTPLVWCGPDSNPRPLAPKADALPTELMGRLCRNNCSSLNNDLIRNHVRDNLLCELCGLIEDAIHFFFHCIKYIDERQVFNDTVREFQPLTINLILFGSENWNIQTNVVLFRAIHRYIHASKRF